MQLISVTLAAYQQPKAQSFVLMGRRDRAEQRLLEQYVDSIANTPLRSVSEENRLLRLWMSTGQPQAYQQWFGSQLHRVIDMARRFEHQGAAIMDLISAGNLGLTKGIGRWLHNNFNFKTEPNLKGYRPAINRAIVHELRQAVVTQSTPMPISDAMRRRLKRMESVDEQSMKTNQRPATWSEIQKALELSAKQLKHLKQAWMVIQQQTPHPHLVGETPDGPVLDRPPTHQTPLEEAVTDRRFNHLDRDFWPLYWAEFCHNPADLFR